MNWAPTIHPSTHHPTHLPNHPPTHVQKYTTPAMQYGTDNTVTKGTYYCTPYDKTHVLWTELQPSIHPPTYLTTHPPTYRSTQHLQCSTVQIIQWQRVHITAHLTISLMYYELSSIHPPIHPPSYPPTYLTTHPFFFLMMMTVTPHCRCHKAVNTHLHFI